MYSRMVRYKLTVDATGYKSQSIAFTYDKVLENDLSLTVDYADDKEAFAAEKKKIIIRLTILQMLNLPLRAAREIS